jgi:hypothetical protein
MFKHLPLALAALLFSSNALAGSNACQLQKGMKVSELSAGQTKELFKLTTILASPTELQLTEFENNSELKAILLFALNGLQTCEKSSRPIIQISRDPRASIKNIVKIIMHLNVKNSKEIPAVCAVAVKSKVRTCILEIVSGI